MATKRNLKFTVVTPTIVEPRALTDRCIGSIDAQTHTNWEHIVVIDGPEPVIPAEWDHPQRRFLRCARNHKVGGIPCRSWGGSQAEGDYVVYLDEDDYYSPDCFETLNAMIEDEPFGVFTMELKGGRWLVDPPGTDNTSLIQMYHKAVIDGERVYFPSGPLVYNCDSRWAGEMAAKYGYRLLDPGRPLAFTPTQRNSCGVPGQEGARAERWPGEFAGAEPPK